MLFRSDLVDMMTFDRVEFEKNISLSVKKKVKIESKFDLVKIGQIASTQYGFTDKATDQGETRYLRITDLNDDGSINLNNEAKYINPSDETKTQFLLENNDIVIARSGSVGKSAIYKSEKYDKMIFASYLIRLKADENKILPDYLFNFTKTQMYWNQVDANSVAVTQPNLNAEKIKEFQIPLPPIDIQQKIVSEIEVLEIKEKKAKEEVEKLKAETSNLFENSIKKINSFLLKDIIELQNGKDLSKSSRIEGEYFIYGGNGILGKLNEYLVEKPTIAIGRVGAYCGAVHLTKEKSWITDNSMFVSNYLKEVNIKFLYFSLKKLNLNQFANAASHPNISQPTVLNQKIPLPPLSEQQKIVSEIEKIEEKIKVLETEISEIPKQKEAILKKYL